MGKTILLSEAVDLYRQEQGAPKKDYEWYRRHARRSQIVPIGTVNVPVYKENGRWVVDEDRLHSALALHSKQTQLNNSAGKTGKRSLWSQVLKYGGTLLTGVIIGILPTLFSPAVTHAVSDIHDQIFGVNHPIELSPICKQLGGIVEPPPEDGAAYKWQCAHSELKIAQRQITQRCRQQWGPDAKVILLDPNSPSGWTCQTTGWLD